ncbi:MAG: type I glutamate--ammonia ligase [Planctomycetota bacterium]|nr:type I glutamate--ammonia ligase [Planctomycetota bacterium]
MTPRQVLQLVKSQGIEFIDCRFMDFPGLWQHITFPASRLTARSIVEGIGFDGSSVRGWQAVNESDMLLVPVVDTARVDPFLQHPTLSIICDVKDPVTKKEYSRDPRSIARKAAAYLVQTGVADRATFAPEVEFFVFDNVWYDQSINQGGYQVDSAEGVWNRGKRDAANLGYHVRQREGYFPCPPMDSLTNLRSEMVDVLGKMGIGVDEHHHEVATGGQCEIDLAAQELVAISDACMYLKYVVKNVAARHGKVATFMPKPLLGDNGSGMHTHLSLWKGGKPLMAGRKYAGLSDMGLHAIGGLLKHAPALLALTNPTTNSFKRLVPGYEAPVNLAYSSRNRSAAVRIPVYEADPGAKRIEFRCPDSSCNPYLAFAAMLMAAIDGVRNRIDPGDPLDKELQDLEPSEYEAIPSAPSDLHEALNALEADHAFLLEGGVFSQELIHHWIRYKRQNEVAALRTRPHPFEFCMYFDI